MADGDLDWAKPSVALSQADAADVIAAAIFQAGRSSAHLGDAALIRAEAARIVAVLLVSDYRLVALR